MRLATKSETITESELVGPCRILKPNAFNRFPFHALNVINQPNEAEQSKDVITCHQSKKYGVHGVGRIKAITHHKCKANNSAFSNCCQLITSPCLVCHGRINVRAFFVLF